MKRDISRILAPVLILSILAIPACETGAQTGALGGAGVGALAGGLAGGWKWAAIGSAIGAGSGYIIGNESDKAAAKRYSSTPASELQPLSGTRWNAVDVVSTAPRKYETFMAEFRPDGTLFTSGKLLDGTTRTAEEKYRIVGDILIVNKADYILNLNWQLDGDTLIVSGIGEDRVHFVGTFERA